MTTIGSRVMARHNGLWKRGKIVGHVERVTRRWPRRTEMMTLVEVTTESVYFGVETVVVEKAAADVVPEPNGSQSAGVSPDG